MSGRLVLVRHGQSHGNVERRLDTRPPGAALTDLGREQARASPQSLAAPARRWSRIRSRCGPPRPPPRSAPQLGLAPTSSRASTRFRSAIWRTATTTTAIEEFDAVYQRWHEGDLDVPMPGGESAQQVLDRYLPVVTQLRVRYLDDHAWTGDIVVVSHGAAIRLVVAVLAGVDRGFALEHHLANAECVVLSPITDGRWSCLQWGTLTPPFYPEAEAPRRGRAARQPTRWADGTTPQAQAQPTASQSMLNACTTSGVDAVVLGALGPDRQAWWMTVPWQCSRPARHSRHCRSVAWLRFIARADARVPISRRVGAFASARAQAQPSSCSRSSSMPKWWAISWITVIATSSTTSSSVSQTSSSASR